MADKRSHDGEILHNDFMVRMGLSVTDLALEMNVTVTAIRGIISGEREKNP